MMALHACHLERGTMAKSKQDRNAGLTQLTLPGVKLPDAETLAMAAAFAADEAEAGSTAPIGPAKWIPPHHPTLEGHAGYSSTAYSVFDWWWASIEVKDPAHGYWSHLFEWDALANDWRFVTKLHGESLQLAHQATRRAARRILIEGQRPEAERQSPELAGLVAFWREHGTHALARDLDG